jgi:hypothetical protein
MKQSFRIAAVLILVLSFSTVIMAQSDPRIGTWKLNVSKSKFDPGPPPKSETRTYSADGDGVKVTREQIDGTGKTISSTYTVKSDGLPD